MTSETPSPRVEKPSHVPDELVVDFDMRFDPGLLADPPTRIWELVTTTPPIFWAPYHGGYWVFRGHQAVFEAARDPETFSSNFLSRAQLDAMKPMLSPDGKHIPQAVPITLDPPEHTAYRRPLQSTFSPRAMSELRDGIHELAGELIDAVKHQGSCEFVSSVSEQLPVKVFLKLLGLSLDRFDEWRALAREYMAGTSDPDPRKQVARARKVADAMADTVAARREHPEDDLISHLWQLEVDGRKTETEDMENYGVLLFVAGLDTVMQGIGHGVRWLATDMSLQNRLRQDPSLIKEATEEILRRFTFTVPVRRVTRDCEFQGVQLKAGEKALIYLPCADLDPEQFERPDVCDIDRENTTHIAFNAGPHRCLGSHLARLELQVIYEEMVTRLPEFKVDESKPIRFLGGNVIGIDEMHLHWDASRVPTIT